jgi:hypothetical protein
VTHRIVALLFLLLLAIAGTSCSTTPAPRSVAMPAVAVAVTSADGSRPSTEQLTRIYQAMQPELLKVGLRLAEGRNAADFVVTVSFTPTPGGSGGRIAVTGIEPSAEFRRKIGNGESEEARELRRRVREMEMLMQPDHPVQ